MADLKPARERMQLDSARTGVERAGELGNVPRPGLDPAEWDQHAVGGRGGRDHRVVLLAVGGHVGVAEGEHERALDAEPASLAGQQLDVEHRAVLVLAEVRVHVPERLAGGEQWRDQVAMAAVDEGGSGHDRVRHQ